MSERRKKAGDAYESLRLWDRVICQCLERGEVGPFGANDTGRSWSWRSRGEEEQGHQQDLFMVSNAQSPLAFHSCLVREPVLNDDLPSYILTGRITVKPGVKEFKENSVVFHNCPEEEPIDIVVFCTGYNVSFPFLEEAVVKVENKHASLYKYVFPTHLQRPTLAILGLIKPLGAIMPVTEMQARWVTRVFKGRRANMSSPMYKNAVQTGHVLSVHQDGFQSLGTPKLTSK